ncbi:MAG: hypothetical protein WKG52_11600 [Variovorax sp.]
MPEAQQVAPAGQPEIAQPCGIDFRHFILIGVEKFRPAEVQQAGKDWTSNVAAGARNGSLVGLRNTKAPPLDRGVAAGVRHRLAAQHRCVRQDGLYAAVDPRRKCSGIDNAARVDRQNVDRRFCFHFSTP